jgi:hypothetical protein
MSVVEAFIPDPQQMVSVFLDEPLDAFDLISPEPPTTLQPDRIESEFGGLIRTLEMNMRWLLPITCLADHLHRRRICRDRFTAQLALDRSPIMIETQPFILHGTRVDTLQLRPDPSIPLHAMPTP